MELWKKNKITFQGKNYYMLMDFAIALDRKPNAIYQMIHRGTIRNNHILKRYKSIFITEAELNVHLNK